MSAKSTLKVLSLILVLILSACQPVLVIPQQTAGAQPEPGDLPSAVEALRTATAPYGSMEQIVTFANNGQEVMGTLTLPEGASPPYPTVLLLHGFTGTRDELPVTGTEEGMYSRTARILAENGMASLRIDFRGSGESGGAWEDTTFNGQIDDTIVALDYLETLPQVNTDHMGVIGLSQGGLVAASAAAQDDRIKSVVLWSPVANPVDTYSLLLGREALTAGLVSGGEPVDVVTPWGAEFGLRTGFFEDVFGVDPVAAVTDVEDPLLVIVGLRDDTVTPQPYYGQLYLNYHDGTEQLVALDGDHVFDVLTEAGPQVLDEAIRWSLAWLKRTL